MSIEKAITFASLKHLNQMRKGSKLPYIIHPIEVMYILKENNCEEDVVIAGILHDVLEDTDTTEQELRQEFGDAITDLVLFESEDKSKTWQERKAKTIEEIKNMPLKPIQLLCADKLSNLNSIYRDLTIIGDEVWSRFKAPKEKVLWYYESILENLKIYLPKCKMLDDFTKTFNRLINYKPQNNK